jgi:hypothetical protein
VFTYSSLRTQKPWCTITNGDAKNFRLNPKCNLAGFGQWDIVYDDVPGKNHFQSAQIAAEKFCGSDVKFLRNLGGGLDAF